MKTTWRKEWEREHPMFPERLKVSNFVTSILRALEKAFLEPEE